jgi:hypothetical protein
MKAPTNLAGAAALGAGLMYVLDPNLGRRRRALLRDIATHSGKLLARGVDITGRDTVHRMKGILQKTKDLFRSEYVPDEVLTERLRTEIGRVSSHPNVEVIVKDGVVTLLGPVVVWEELPVLKAARTVKGAHEIVNRMEPYRPGENMPTQASRRRQLDVLQRHWAPATRAVAGALGASAVAAGIKSRTTGALLLGAAGLAVVARAITNCEFKRMAGFKRNLNRVA